MAEVGCAGMLVADTFCGPIAAIPGEGELLTIERMPMSVGGCAANVAVGLARQGLAVDVVGCVGADPAGAFVRADLARSGVGVAQVREAAGLPTSQTVVLLVAGEDRRYLHVVGANAAFRAEEVDRAWVRGLGLLYVGGICAMPGVDFGALAALFREARAAGVETALDVVVPAGESDFVGLRAVLPHVDLFVPNDDEAARVTGEADPVAQCRTLRALGTTRVAVTLGAAGAVAAEGDDLWRVPPFAVAATDPSGGGDAFAAGLIATMRRGASFRDAVVWGQAVGASATTKVGTTAGVFTWEETAAFLCEQREA